MKRAVEENEEDSKRTKSVYSSFWFSIHDQQPGSRASDSNNLPTIYLPAKMDPFAILQQEKARYAEQFNSLKPAGGFVSGDQAKGFLLQSQLPPVILGHIW